MTKKHTLLRGFERLQRLRGRAVALGLDLGGLLLAKLDDVVDQIGVVRADRLGLPLR